jgi:hypothetical protein
MGGSDESTISGGERGCGGDGGVQLLLLLLMVRGVGKDGKMRMVELEGARAMMRRMVWRRRTAETPGEHRGLLESMIRTTRVMSLMMMRMGRMRRMGD